MFVLSVFNIFISLIGTCYCIQIMRILRYYEFDVLQT